MNLCVMLLGGGGGGCWEMYNYEFVHIYLGGVTAGKCIESYIYGKVSVGVFFRRTCLKTVQCFQLFKFYRNHIYSIPIN